ncbi:hypothetical protein Tco_0549939, partial [Tanacetum coccineum]
MHCCIFGGVTGGARAGGDGAGGAGAGGAGAGGAGAGSARADGARIGGAGPVEAEVTGCTYMKNTSNLMNQPRTMSEIWVGLLEKLG